MAKVKIKEAKMRMLLIFAMLKTMNKVCRHTYVCVCVDVPIMKILVVKMDHTELQYFQIIDNRYSGARLYIPILWGFQGFHFRFF